MLRKLSYLVLAMSSIAVNIYAIPRDPCSGFKIRIEGLDFRGNGDFLQYANLSPIPSTSGPTSLTLNQIKKVIPGYDLGYGLAIGYVFPCLAYDVEAHWQHFDSDDSNSIRNPSPNTMIEVPFILGNGLTFNTASGRAEFKYNVFDLDLGRSINCFNCFQTRFYAGIRYARIEREFTLRQEDPVFEDQPVRFINFRTNLKFMGAGPQIGIYSTYYFISSLGFESDLSISGIAQKAKSNTIAQVLVGPDNFEITTIIKPDDQYRVSPAIDARLGLQYRYQFCNGTSIKLSAGYQYVDYIGVFNEVIVATGINGGVSSIDFRKIDASFQGPYVSLSVKI